METRKFRESDWLIHRTSGLVLTLAGRYEHLEGKMVSLVFKFGSIVGRAALWLIDVSIFCYEYFYTVLGNTPNSIFGCSHCKTLRIIQEIPCCLWLYSAPKVHAQEKTQVCEAYCQVGGMQYCFGLQLECSLKVLCVQSWGSWMVTGLWWLHSSVH